VPRSVLPGVVTATALLTGGCGTVANTFGCNGEEGARRVYGGVRLDLAGPCGNLLDVPLSAVGDTVTLPVTVPCSLYRLTHRSAGTADGPSPDPTPVHLKDTAP
jgi:uncharacterized protein YceK